MSTAIAVLDRAPPDARTDVIVVADPRARRLLWVPRDLWCEELGDRVNVAWKRGGHSALRAALAEHAISVEHSICLPRATVAAHMEGLRARVPVSEPLEFRYPADPKRWKRIRFDPPHEDLEGERLHQWIGARYGLDGRGSDLPRIARQQQLVAVLLASGFDFGGVLRREPPPIVSDPGALEELAEGASGWRLETLEGLEWARRRGQIVLIRPSP
jgi:hypothetical protein